MKNLKNESANNEKSGFNKNLPLKKKKFKRTNKKDNSKVEKLAKLAKINSDQILIPKDYQMHDTYYLGDYIEHKTFGKGIVDAIIEHNKIKIIFMSGEKILVHTRKLVQTI